MQLYVIPFNTTFKLGSVQLVIAGMANIAARPWTAEHASQMGCHVKWDEMSHNRVSSSSSIPTYIKLVYLNTQY